MIVKEAKNEILLAHRYYKSKQKSLASHFTDCLNDYFETIQLQPESFSMKKPPFREAPLRKFPFVIIYEFVKSENTIIVYAVFNTWQNPFKKPKR